MNLQEQRCPHCLASLSNSNIGDMEVARFHLKEAADVEKANAWNTVTRRAITLGLITGAIGMVLSLSIPLVLVGGIVGGLAAWFTAWRRIGQLRTCMLFTIMMAPFAIPLGANFFPFTLLTIVLTGMAIGIANNLARD